MERGRYGKEHWGLTETFAYLAYDFLQFIFNFVLGELSTANSNAVRLFSRQLNKLLGVFRFLLSILFMNSS